MRRIILVSSILFLECINPSPAHKNPIATLIQNEAVALAVVGPLSKWEVVPKTDGTVIFQLDQRPLSFYFPTSYDSFTVYRFKLCLQGQVYSNSGCQGNGNSSNNFGAQQHTYSSAVSSCSSDSTGLYQWRLIGNDSFSPANILKIGMQNQIFSTFPAQGRYWITDKAPNNFPTHAYISPGDYAPSVAGASDRNYALCEWVGNPN